MTENTDKAITAACARLRTMPPIAHVAGDSSVLSTAGLPVAFGGGVAIADDMGGIPPRGVPV